MNTTENSSHNPSPEVPNPLTRTLKNGPVLFPREKRRDGAGDVTRNDVKEGYLVSLVTSARLFSNEAFDNGMQLYLGLITCGT